jgi:addiction module HigA family antidote
MTEKKLPPIHPGEILMEEFLKPLDITQHRIAKDINVPFRMINEIVHGKRNITPGTALRLSRYFGLSERFWINLQSRYDLEIEKDRLKDRLASEVQIFAAI